MISDMAFMVKEGVQYAMEGESFVRNVRVPTSDGSIPTLASPTMTVYKNGTDTLTTFATGSMSVAGDVITTKTLTNLVGGDNLHVVIFVTLNGVALQCVAEFPIMVRKKSGR